MTNLFDDLEVVLRFLKEPNKLFTVDLVEPENSQNGRSLE